MTNKKKLVGVVSPPYEESLNTKDKEFYKKTRIDHKRNFDVPHFNQVEGYRNSEGQIGMLKTKENPQEIFDIIQFHSCSDSLYWHGCYSSETQWKKYVTPESYAHPAKASFLLIDRIFKHLKKLELLNEGDTICDFMAGSGRTNIVASLHGFDSMAVELEPHFIKMINDNTALTKKQINRDVDVHVIQGDSRKLSSILREANVGIVSPPYQDMINGGEGNNPNLNKTIKLAKQGIRGQQYRHRESYSKPVGIISPPYEETQPINYQKEHAGPIGINSRMKENRKVKNIMIPKDKPFVGIVSPPYSKVDDRISKGKIQEGWIAENLKSGRTYEASMHGKSEGQIGNLPDKNLVGITSPPYEEVAGEKHHSPRADKLMQEKRAYGTYTERNASSQQIGNLKDKKSFIGITSPPYENRTEERHGNLPKGDSRNTFSYGSNKENLGNQQGESYLSAMLQVYREAAKVMPVLVTITKNPTRKGQLRRLDIDTAKLLMMAGYEIVDYHRAVLFDERKQATLKGSIVKQMKGRLSFFKRLSIQKGNIAAKWEDVIVAVRK